MNHWIYPANVKFYDVVQAFEQPWVYWPMNSTVLIDDIIFIYLSAPYKQIAYIGKVVEVNLSTLNVAEHTQPYIKNINNQSATQKSFMKLAVTCRITLNSESVLSYENLKLNGLNGPLLGPRKLENNSELHYYISQNI